jgi:hypothetical protein
MNSDKEKYKEYFETLELEESASLAEINQAFKKLTELYASDSMVTDPIEDEFTQEERQEIVNQLEEAYKGLLSYIVERDRVEKEAEKEEEMEDTAEEDEEEEEEEKIEKEKKEEKEEKETEEEDYIFELEEKERIGDDESLEKTLAEEDFNTNPAPIDLSGGEEDRSVSVHENEYVHEPVHIELPEKEDISEKKESEDQYPYEDSFEIVSTDVDKDISEKKKDKKKPPWDESLFEKDIKEIKEELTKDLTRDIKAGLTIPQKKPGDEKAGEEGGEGLKIKGRSLRKVREQLGIGIHEIAVKTRINYKILVNIEKERFSKLPDAGHLRYYLTTYAKALFLDPQKVADQYMRRFRIWKRTKGE